MGRIIRSERGIVREWAEWLFEKFRLRRDVSCSIFADALKSVLYRVGGKGLLARGIPVPKELLEKVEGVRGKVSIRKFVKLVKGVTGVDFNEIDGSVLFYGRLVPERWLQIIYDLLWRREESSRSIVEDFQRQNVRLDIYGRVFLKRGEGKIASILREKGESLEKIARQMKFNSPQLYDFNKGKFSIPLMYGIRYVIKWDMT